MRWITLIILIILFIRLNFKYRVKVRNVIITYNDYTSYFKIYYFKLIYKSWDTC